ncbi:PTS sugar transporter subunit IIA [Streptococcus didelphis]|uniref:PTS sugar transporter subunit IIA n=1 Tax=Streptococcus didelphis TaxID=102886 RepID=A0ABY9LIF5_9STRE|nr:PTS sugar transporter subunit IIA [Streptococcus didelphis]WMB28632.1 PTS sugar transporter subunit IIA [Streptococcus didelphis]WMB29313.1 PTS sugar transporter subunit IIA [Streptococcus didelphis]
MFSDILFTEAKTQEELFEQVANQLQTQVYVTADYKEALKKREKDFPTGLKIDYKDGSDVLFAAIPHTETQYCLVDRLVYVKNSFPITFKHMINPQEDCYAKHFFFIINSKKSGQTQLLSNVITFFISKGNLQRLEDLGNHKKEIKDFLVEKGVLNND